MIKRFLFFITICFLLSSCWINPKILIVVDQVPDNTPEGANLYISGTFNNWNPADESCRLKKTQEGRYTIAIPVGEDGVQYKFTRGSWETVETSVNGDMKRNRHYNIPRKDTVNVQIEGWEDMFTEKRDSTTANEGVRILAMEFDMPQLGRNRTIRAYLPADYDSSGRRYPVLYMHDAQNLFDQVTSYAGEWEIDETMEHLETAGDSGIIIIGIDNGQEFRMNEYAPWKNPQFGEPEGEAYMAFVVETLKPFIDSTLRTKPGPEYTGLMGSSMGGLISFYGGMKYQDVFGKIGALSSSFWFSDEIYSFIEQTGKKADTRFYFIVGANEGSDMVEGSKTVYSRMLEHGFSKSDLFLKVHPDGHHREWYWAREFADAYRWLFHP